VFTSHALKPKNTNISQNVKQTKGFSPLLQGRDLSPKGPQGRLKPHLLHFDLQPPSSLET
jgi:hypothetical protein